MKQKSIHLNISTLKQNTWLFLCLLIITIVFMCLGIRKDIWFCDEVYTYESANSGNIIHLTIENGFQEVIYANI